MDFGMATPYKRLRNKGYSMQGSSAGDEPDGSMWLENFSSMATPRSDTSKMSFTLGDNNLMKTIVGNVHYAAPEVLGGCGYDHTVDWWAVGVMYFHFLSGVTPFASNISDDQVKFNVLERVINWSAFPSNLSNDCSDVINLFLTKKPELRLGQKGFKEIKSHTHFKDIDFDTLLSTPGPLIPKSHPLKFEPMNGGDSLFVLGSKTDEFFSL